MVLTKMFIFRRVQRDGVGSNKDLCTEYKKSPLLITLEYIVHKILYSGEYRGPEANRASCTEI